MKKKLITIFTIAATGLGAYSCAFDRSPDSGNYDPNDPGTEYNPYGDMYYSIPYDPMTQFGESEFLDSVWYRNNLNPHNMNMRLPAEGTVARGKMDYHYPYTNTEEGYQQAGRELTNPYQANEKMLAEGKNYYEMYCWQCHGKEKQPVGSIVAAGKFPPPTWDFERLGFLDTLPVGKMYHVITYGRNLMGPHGPIVTPEQRWKIIAYLKNKAGAAPASTEQAASDTTANAAGAAATADTTANNTANNH